MRKLTIIILVVVLLVCGVGVTLYIHDLPTPIGKIISHPRDYETGEARIAGRVTERASMLLFRYFKLEDKSGEITVITDRALPNVGDQVEIRGHVEQALAIGALQTTVFREVVPK